MGRRGEQVVTGQLVVAALIFPVTVAAAEGAMIAVSALLLTIARLLPRQGCGGGQGS